MSYSDLWRLFSQAKVPILLAVLVVFLVLFALAADERRKCRETCLRAGHADYSYKHEIFGGASCDCITRDGKTVAAPQTAH
jgi:hypothetical protein